MKVHAFETATLVGNETFFRSDRFGSLLRPPRDLEFPVLSFVVEHPDGLIAIDTGLGTVPPVPRAVRRMVPAPVAGTERSMATQMRAAGLDPEEVRAVVLTHLDWDHAGGMAQFPRARLLVHRPELDYASTRFGRMRYRPDLWPEDRRPDAYELEPEPAGPFPESREIAAGLRVVPLPGHSAGQVGVLMGDLLFTADAVMNLDWFREDAAAGRELGVGKFFPERGRETMRRLQAFDGVLLPSHDPATPARLRASVAGRSGTDTSSTPRTAGQASR